MKYIKNHISFLSISILLLFILTASGVINYYFAKRTLNNTLTTQAIQHESDFNIILKMTYGNLQHMSTIVGNIEELNEIFLRGKKGIEANTPEGKVLADAARQELFKRVKPMWEAMTYKFRVRQLHYHLGPGSLSFLRVHRADKYGDRMDELRYIIADTYDDKIARTGYEIGRVYGGLRSTTPIWYQEIGKTAPTFVGVVETGTSFDSMLEIYSDNYSASIAVLLDKDVVDEKLWDEYIPKLFDKVYPGNVYVEGISKDSEKPLLYKLLEEHKLYGVKDIRRVRVANIDNNHYAIHGFPLYDYKGKRDGLPPVGTIVVWKDVTKYIHEFDESILKTFLFGIISFTFFEWLLFVWARQKENYLEAKHQSLTDGMTGIYNRRYFDITLKQAFNETKRNSDDLSIILFDIDSFKAYNDTYGHQAGDSCIRQITLSAAAVLFRSTDWMARYGGEEFVVVLPGTDKEAAMQVAERIRAHIEQLCIPHATSLVDTMCVTISAGVVHCKDYETVTELIKAVDINLYKAKNNGRNTVVG